MTRCPHCFAAVLPDHAAFVCVSGCDELVDAQFSAYHGVERPSRTLTIFDPPPGVRNWAVPTSAACWKCKGATTECCRECHYPFPPKWRLGEALCVAYAGARFTSKSNSIATMVHSLERYTASRTWSCIHATATSRANYEVNYQNPLFARRGVLPPTARAVQGDAYQREPLILSLGTIKGHARYLVIRDAAGEDLEADDDPQHLTFFGRAHLVVFLFDPTQVPDVRDQIKDNMPVNNLDGNPIQVLEHLLRLIGDGKPWLAVSLAKLDALWMVGDAVRQSAAGAQVNTFQQLSRAMANTGSALRTDLSWSLIDREFDRALAQIHEESRSLLLMLHAAPLVNLVERSDRGKGLKSAFFASSALGHPPNAQGLSKHGIAPFRVLDPILWLFREENLL